VKSARGSSAANAQSVGRAASRRHERHDGEVSSAFEVAYLEFQANSGLAPRCLGPADLDNPGGGGENTPKRGGLNGGQRDGLASCLATTAQETKVL